MKRFIPFSPPDITEAEITEVAAALRSGWITTGPKTKEFERRIADFCGASRAACLNSATAALELTLRILGIGPGDEVITSAYTYTASASVICHTGATPVLVDLAPNSLEMDLDLLEQAITPRTKAIIPVDLAGIPCDYPSLRALAEAESTKFTPSNAIAGQIGRIAIIADAAHSFGAQRGGIPTGSLADFTCFSFHAVKNLTTAEGGAAVFSETNGKNIDEIYNQYMLLSLHGQSKDALAKTQLGAWEYDILSPAYKCNMTDIAAALGLAQLERYPGLLERRRALIHHYDAAFADSRIRSLPHFTSEYSSSGHLYLTWLQGADQAKRNETILQLAEAGISVNVHYKPLPLLTAYRKMGFSPADFPRACARFENELTLPLHTLLSDLDADYIAEKLLQFLEK